MDENLFSASINKYSQETKLFTERIVTYWTNFVKYDNPNFLNASTNASDYWRPFSKNNKTQIDSYLVFDTNGQINMRSGYSSHQCEFWKAISSNSYCVCMNNQIYLMFFLLSFIKLIYWIISDTITIKFINIPWQLSFVIKLIHLSNINNLKHILIKFLFCIST